MRVGGGEICLIGPVYGPLLRWQNDNSKEKFKFQRHAFIIQVQPPHRTWGWFLPLFFPFHSFWTDSIHFPQWHVQPCTDAAIDDFLIHLLAERPFGWIYVPRFLCIINSVLWEKERNVMARPPQRNVPIWEEEFYRGSHWQPLSVVGIFFCSTASPLMINGKCLIAGSVVWQLQFGQRAVAGFRLLFKMS